MSSFSILAVLISAGAALATPVSAQAANAFCAASSQDRQTLGQTPGLFSGTDAWADLKERQTEATSRLSQQIFAAYIDQTATLSEMQSCFRAQDWKALSESLPQAFYQGSFNRLSQLRNPSVQLFAQRALELISNGSLVQLGLETPVDADSSTNLRFGGFHRGEAGLYLNPYLLPPDQWYTILIHEFTHAMDPILQIASQTSHALYENESAMRAKLSARTPVATALADALALNGLNRGLFAEYRAWTVTAKLQGALEREGVSHRLQWLAPYQAAADDSPAVFERSVFLQLESAFSDPRAGLFALDVVAEQLRIAREQARRNTPPLGPGLEPFLGRPSSGRKTR